MSEAAPERVTVPTDDGPMPAYLWTPDRRPAPGLVLVQEIFGISRYVRDRALDLAALGYVVLVPDLYWRLSDREIDEEAPDALERAMGVAQRVDWEATVGDVVAARRLLRDLDGVDGRAGLIGFCFGGGVAFNAAALDLPDVLVSYYGSALPALLGLADRVTCPSLHHFGLADSFIPPQTVTRIEQAVTAHGAEFATYEGADHAFDNPQFVNYDRAASASAWERTNRFLAGCLPLGRPPVG